MGNLYSVPYKRLNTSFTYMCGMRDYVMCIIGECGNAADVEIDEGIVLCHDCYVEMRSK